MSRCGDDPRTGAGGRQRRTGLPWIGRHARRELALHGVALAVIDPVWGRDSVLWPVLDEVIGYTTNDQGMRTSWVRA